MKIKLTPDPYPVEAVNYTLYDTGLVSGEGPDVYFFKMNYWETYQFFFHYDDEPTPEPVTA